MNSKAAWQNRSMKAACLLLLDKKGKRLNSRRASMEDLQVSSLSAKLGRQDAHQQLCKQLLNIHHTIELKSMITCVRMQL